MRVFLLGEVVGEMRQGGPVEEDGTFEWQGVPAGLYHVQVTAKPDVYLKSVTVGSRDIRESGIDLSSGGAADMHVLLSANGATLTGSVDNGAGAVVTLIPTGSHAQPQAVIAGRNGEFTFQALPPGSYSLLAWGDADMTAALYDPDFRKPFESSAQTIDLRENQKATIQLKAVARSAKNQ